MKKLFNKTLTVNTTKSNRLWQLSGVLVLLTPLYFSSVWAGCIPNRESTSFADVTGDARADAIVINETGITVRRSDGTKFLNNESWTNEAYHGKLGTYFADVTGDGKADAIVVNRDKITVRRSNGARFLSNESWTTNPYFGYNRNNGYIYFADVTGDGKADAIVTNRFGVTVRRSDGTKFLDNETWTNEPYYGNVGTYFADVNGDRMADAIVVNRDGITVRLSNGARFTSYSAWTNDTYYSLFFGGLDTHFADVTNDGRADAIVVDSGRIVVRASDGTRFVPNPTGWTTNSYYGGIGTYFVNVNNDRMADAIVVNLDGVTVKPSNGSQFQNNQSWTANAYYGGYMPICKDVEIPPVCGVGLFDPPIDTNTANLSEIAQQPGQVVLGYPLGILDALLVVVDEAPQLRQDQMLVTLDINPRNGVTLDKEIQAWGATCHSGAPLASVKAHLVGNVANCNVLTNPTNLIPGCTQTQSMLLDKRSATELRIRKSGIFGLNDVRVMDSSMWQAFGGRSVRFIWWSN